MPSRETRVFVQEIIQSSSDEVDIVVVLKVFTVNAVFAFSATSCKPQHEGDGLVLNTRPARAVFELHAVHLDCGVVFLLERHLDEFGVA